MPEELPLHIALGEIFVKQEVSGSRYSFEHIPLKGIPVKTFPDDTDPDPLKDMTTLENASQMIYFKKIKATLNKNINGKIDPPKEPNYSYAVTYDETELEKNSGFITPLGTIVPNFFYVRNFGENSLELAEQSEIDREKWDNANKSYKYNWYAIKKKESETPNPDDPETKKAISNIKNYGVVLKVDDVNSYISILGKNPLIHKDGFEQKYISNFPEEGAFALLLDFTSYEFIEGKNCGVKFRFFQEGNDMFSSGKPDVVEVSASPGSNIKVEINSNGGTEGPLTFSQQGLKISHTNSDCLSTKNVIYFYSLLNNIVVTGDLVTDPEQNSKNLFCKKDKELNIANETTPPINQFPALHKIGKANELKVDSRKAYIKFGNRVECTWYNCTGNFGFAALRYAPKVSFSYFYRLSGEQTQNNDGISGIEDYFLLEVGRQNYKYTIPQKVVSRKVAYDKETQTSIFRADFSFNSTELNALQKYPIELFGLIHVTKRTGKLTDVLNEDGDFQTYFTYNHYPTLYTGYTNEAANCDNTAGWEKFITNVSVQHGLDGTTGTLTLDKYLMMRLNLSPFQVIGALTLVAQNGFYNQDGTTMNGGTHTIVPYEQYELPWGQFFKGYAMEIQDQVSDSSSTLNVRLVGIQKKLADMKLVNCPFWDGDAVFTSGVDGVLNYFISYTGCRLKYVPEFSKQGVSVNDIILPRSWDWKAPAVNFVLGTPCLDALREIAKKINHQFIIQPDGCGYFYHMDRYGCPEWVYNGPIVATFTENDIISMDISPYLENRYNTFLTMGILAKRETQDGSLFPAGEEPGMKFSQVSITSNNYPWSRIYTFAEPGIVTIKELEEFHRINVQFGTSEIFQGNVTIPGCHAFCLFDRIMIGAVSFYLTGINHNLNMQTKEWTTSLSVAKFEVNTGA